MDNTKRPELAWNAYTLLQMNVDIEDQVLHLESSPVLGSLPLLAEFEALSLLYQYMYIYTDRLLQYMFIIHKEYLHSMRFKHTQSPVQSYATLVHV